MWLKQLEQFNILPFNKVVLFLSAILWILRSQGQEIRTSFQNQNLYTCFFLSVLSLDKQGNILLVSNFYRSKWCFCWSIHSQSSWAYAGGLEHNHQYLDQKWTKETHKQSSPSFSCKNDHPLPRAKTICPWLKISYALFTFNKHKLQYKILQLVFHQNALLYRIRKWFSMVKSRNQDYMKM